MSASFLTACEEQYHFRRKLARGKAARIKYIARKKEKNQETHSFFCCLPGPRISNGREAAAFFLPLTILRSALTVSLMNSSRNDISAPSGHDPEENSWVLAAKAGPEELSDCSLVLSAIGIDHQLDWHGGVILVRKRNSSRAMSELRMFREENQNWPPQPSRPRAALRTADSPFSLLLMGILILFYWATGPWDAANPWFEAGAVSSEAILKRGEWWRLLTALTLHADQTHLVGNCVIGGIMAHLLGRAVGEGTAWLTLLTAGMSGNLLNILLRREPHYSVGFSTAVFAAIGIFCGRALGSGARQLILPLGAGAGLLAMLGSGGEHTDLGAHLFGLLSGLLCGLILRKSGLDQHGSRQTLQRLLLCAALTLTALCWLLAAGGQIF